MRGMHRHTVFSIIVVLAPYILSHLFICESVRLSYRELYYAHERLLAGWLAAMLLGT